MKEVYLVPDNARVYRAREVAAIFEGRTLKEAAAELGVSHTTLRYFLKANGYQTGWVRTKIDQP